MESIINLLTDHQHEFWLLLAFCTFFLLFGKKIYNIIIKNLDDDISSIKEQISKAEELKKQNEELLKKQSELLERFEVERDEMIAKAKEDIAKIFAIESELIEKSIKTREKEMIERINNQRNLAQKELYKELVNLSSKISESYLADNIEFDESEMLKIIKAS